MLSPIRPIQSTEVRRVDEVTPRKDVAARVNSPFVETEEGVRITIGDDARRLAYGRGRAATLESGQTADETTSPTAASAAATKGASGERLFRGSPLPLAFQAQAAEGTNAGSDANTLANRALRSFGVISAAVNDGRGTDSAFAELESDRVFGPDETLKVPFEVFQRAVTQATARPSSDVSAAKQRSFAPMQPVFSAPENGGAPYGRAVPFEEQEAGGPPYIQEGAPSTDTTASSAARTLSSEDVDQLISELTWSLPKTSAATGASAAA